MGERLEEKIRKSLQEGYDPQEVVKVLKQQGYSRQEINSAIKAIREIERNDPEGKTKNNQIKGQKGKSRSRKRDDMSSSGAIGKINLEDDEYMIEQSLWRNKYKVSDSRGDTILKTKQKLFKMKEDFPFTDPEGNEVFSVKAQKIMDIAGDYSVVDEESGKTIAVLSRDFTLVRHRWEIKDSNEEKTLAIIENKNIAVQILRHFSNIASLIPHSYEIRTPNGAELGEIKGQFSIKDRYKLLLNKNPHVNKEVIVAGAIAVDALEHN